GSPYFFFRVLLLRGRGVPTARDASTTPPPDPFADARFRPLAAPSPPAAGPGGGASSNWSAHHCSGAYAFCISPARIFRSGVAAAATAVAAPACTPAPTRRRRIRPSTGAACTPRLTSDTRADTYGGTPSSESRYAFASRLLIDAIG